ncbi:hypothetical protein HII28_02215 [Planctomonas sp. JC2975]|uniref:hypothetical protein n=1 Tax=Planctomonas sp. JC2975 TaxID=2729626 RepID=UPI001475B6C0|nr:hypothetical protein [Planctomonas sp. JC2975]NNC10702.1 hypothetical protein [Planctomonas sp. JC2975]
MPGSILNNMPPQDDDDIRRQRDAQRANVERSAALAYAFATPESEFGNGFGFAVPTGVSGSDPSDDTDVAVCQVPVPDGFTTASVVVFGQVVANCQPPSGTTDWFYSRLRTAASSTGGFGVSQEISIYAQTNTSAIAGPVYYPNLTPQLLWSFTGLSGGHVEAALQVRSDHGWAPSTFNVASVNLFVMFTR